MSSSILENAQIYLLTQWCTYVFKQACKGVEEKLKTHILLYLTWAQSLVKLNLTTVNTKWFISYITFHCANLGLIVTIAGQRLCSSCKTKSGFMSILVLQSS